QHLQQLGCPAAGQFSLAYAKRHHMLFKTATSRNIFAIVAVGVVATVATAGSLFVMSYNQAETATAADMNAVAKVSASQIQGRIQTNMQIVYSIRDTMQAMAADRAGDRVTA